MRRDRVENKTPIKKNPTAILTGKPIVRRFICGAARPMRARVSSTMNRAAMTGAAIFTARKNMPADNSSMLPVRGPEMRSPPGGIRVKESARARSRCRCPSRARKTRKVTMYMRCEVMLTWDPDMGSARVTMVKPI